MEKRHLGERRDVERLVGKPGGPVRGTIEDEHGPVRKNNELAHRAAHEHVVVLFVGRQRTVLRLGRETLAVGRCRVRPSVVIRAVVSLGHIRTATEEESGGIIVGRDHARRAS